MGNYVFRHATLIDALHAGRAASLAHDLGGESSRIWSSTRGRTSTTSRERGARRSDRERGYWRDVGTLDAYFEAHMDLISLDPVFNLYNEAWPILTAPEPLPPAKFVLEEPGRTGMAVDSMVCAGVVVSGGVVRR